MRKSRYTEEYIVWILKESEAGLSTAELCRNRWQFSHNIYRLVGFLDSLRRFASF